MQFLELKKNGLASMGGIFVIIVLFGLVVYLFQTIQAPKQQPRSSVPPDPKEMTGLTMPAFAAA